MSYLYDPHINPTFDATRREIQRSIENLQDKLKKRRALQQQLVKQDTLYHYHGSPVTTFSTIGAYNPPTRLLPYLPPVISQKQILHEDYLNRINHLRLQREALDRKFDLQRLEKERQISRMRDFQYERSHLQDLAYRAQRRSIEYDDEQLLKKYQDGTRAREYTNQLNDIVRDIQRQRSMQKIAEASGYGKSERHLQNYENKLYQASRDNLANTIGVFGDKKYQTQQKNKFQTPYQKLGENSYPKSLNQPVKRNIYPQYDQNEKKYQSNREDNQKIAFNNRRINFALDKKDKTPRKYATIDQKQQSPYQRQQSPYQKQKSPYQGQQSPYQTIVKKSGRDKQEKKSISRTKSNLQNKQLKRSILQRSNTDRREFQANASKKIENRLKLSAIVYEDSKFRNIKHELNHLFMTFNNECKIRKDLKDKINSNMSVLKKYGLNVQG